MAILHQLGNASLVVLTVGIIIFVHELGHFLLARWNGVEVLEFAIGFGPRIWSRKRDTTCYSIRAIPVGGFVRMSGDDPRTIEELRSAKDRGDDIGEEAQSALSRPEGWFISKGYLSKFSIVFAGPLFNYLFAFVLAFAAYAFFGDVVLDEGPVIGDVQPGHPAEKAGLKAGDRVLSIDGVPMESWQQLARTVRTSGGKELQLQVSRSESGEGQAPSSLTIPVKPEPESTDIQVLTGSAAQGHVIGIAPSYHYVPLDSSELIAAAFTKVWRLSVMTVRSFWGLFSGQISRKSIGGPIMMFQEASRSAKRGNDSLLEFMIFLNVTLAIMNLLPIPVLDGGHLLIFSIEAIKGSALNVKIYERVTVMGLLVLLSLMVLALSNDVGRVFGM